ncbi:lipoprotein-releasing system ATP-binding protein LolD [Fusobacterium pseudoperiodonticum]|uniref:Lipoprotein-releasing system ATP-binding protein LolD n=2 Tax=Fusobacteriaceae TaxID=203492 RepID=A0A2G9EBY6_9FUSO|nr:lipoprotein-releasing system ATP-binding protein LolD [Fusobacterium pseudoperiodonticum]ATV65493.1 lipoprotein-releasing system ATP-binding protein LolD [Fusobacterium pseudoperiodonticum]ATV68856.1 lipoprotein-releasing system ATP-binding protein LolD [Fusobacterium pseudoperiodonticum]ATV73246.1 lipoprotein-releasing system ATP-binding protein LolD [Fusobacterium pseudoperiodonticum]PIM78211.1 lipoprotein-releasing system ATP-binding protein LolD [Fusobacterium pseudoperiodonticum]
MKMWRHLDMNNTIIKLEDVDKFYMETGNKLHILKKLNLEVKRGEFVSILGKSGSGKSTLLNIMGLLDKIDGGKIWIDDKEVSSLNETERNNIKNHFLGFVFQFHYLMSEFTALENVMIPALLNNFKNKAEIEKEAKELLEIVGLAERMTHKPNQLSGGEKQRVAIARAMINKPKLILADEPTGNLDEDTGEMIFSLFRKINKERNQSIVVVTHARDLSQVTDRQIYLKRGVLE